MALVKVVRPTEIVAYGCDSPDCSEICDKPGYASECDWLRFDDFDSPDKPADPTSLMTWHAPRLWFCGYGCLARWACERAGC